MGDYVKDSFDVFNRVKDGFTYVSDMEQYGTKEDWRFPENVDNFEGDCDDFAIACRMLLKQKGHECRLLFCRTETGGGHLICAIGKFALDNRMKFPVELTYLTQTKKYTLLSVSGLNPGDAWHNIAGLNSIL
jgi:predicted transglutaminase-like cysteine proteinase